METILKWQCRLGGLAAVLLLCGSVPAVDAGEAPIQAMWKESEVDFTYLGRTSFYSCDSLEHKVERILKEAGARDDLEVRATGCISWFAPERFMTVRIRLAMPVVADPEGLPAEERSRRELIAKVRGSSPAEVELSEPFPATWERVTFSRRLRYLDDADCELVEQLEQHVFKKLDVRVVRSSNWCVPGQIRFGQLDFEIETLKALPKVDEAR